jgi:hypothetical protein
VSVLSLEISDQHMMAVVATLSLTVGAAQWIFMVWLVKQLIRRVRKHVAGQDSP